MAASDRRHRLDWRVILFCVARQSSAHACAEEFCRCRCRRRTVGRAWRWVLSLEEVSCGASDIAATLHWFYWEAYSTWLSGFFLLSLLYYGQAEIYLIDPSVAALTK